MPVYTGTIDEQWADAGVDVALGLITIEELHALGRQTLVERQFEDRDEVAHLRREKLGLEEEVSEERERTDRERAKRHAVEDKLEAANAEIAALEKQVADLERTVRGLQQGA